MMSLTNQQKASIQTSVSHALAEDIGSGDLTASLIDDAEVAGASIIAREPMIVCGQAWVDEVFLQLDERVIVDWYIGDGQNAEAEDIICKLVGPARALLSGERTALNFLQTLSGTATETARYVAELSDSRTRILDTRKTLPGLRQAQKYAVSCGGGMNHRVGLFDAILIKENHIKSAGSITAAVEAATAATRKGNEDVLIEVEVESQDELLEALKAGAGRILLDNFSIEGLKLAVSTNNEFGYTAAELEASGNITLDSLRDIAATGVDYISTGAITKHVRAADLSMLFRIN